EPGRDQSFDIELPRGHQIQHRLEIALLGPAHEANRIVLTTFLVGRVIAPGAVAAADLEGKLLLVEVRTGQLQTSNAHQHDTAALAAHLCGLADWFVALRRGGDDHRIHSTTAGEGLCRRQHIFTSTKVHNFSTKPLGHLQAKWIEINAQYPAPMRTKHLDSEQANETQTGDHHTFTQGGVNQTDTLQSDGGKHGKGGCLVRHILGNLGAQVPWDGHHFGMLTVTYYSVT